MASEGSELLQAAKEYQGRYGLNILPIARSATRKRVEEEKLQEPWIETMTNETYIFIRLVSSSIMNLPVTRNHPIAIHSTYITCTIICQGGALRVQAFTLLTTDFLMGFWFVRNAHVGVVCENDMRRVWCPL